MLLHPSLLGSGSVLPLVVKFLRVDGSCVSVSVSFVVLDGFVWMCQ